MQNSSIKDGRVSHVVENVPKQSIEVSSDEDLTLFTRPFKVKPFKWPLCSTSEVDRNKKS